jgi:hypothetical protein
MIAALINHLWQSTLFCGGAWLITLALRANGAALRHWVWLLASLKFLVPFSLLFYVGPGRAPDPRRHPAFFRRRLQVPCCRRSPHRQPEGNAGKILFGSSARIRWPLAVAPRIHW